MPTRNNFYIFMFWLLLLLLPLKLAALECDSEELNKLKKLASFPEIKYQHIKNYVPTKEEEQAGPLNLKNRFSITINNFSDKFIVKEDYSDNVFQYNPTSVTPTVITKGGFVGGDTYVFNFFATTNDACHYQLLRHETVRLPKYNEYSEHELCQGIEKYRLCDRWFPGDIVSEDYFIEKVNEYRLFLVGQKQNDNNRPLNKWDLIIDWIVVNYIYILVAVAGSGVLIILILKYIDRRRMPL
ncbi:MAG: hypothetical protein WC267_03510 [Bacilli bacterium]